MKKHHTIILAVCVATVIAACGNGSGNTDSVDSAKNINDSVAATKKDSSAMAQATTSPVDKKDADFAVEASNGSMAEVLMGQVAQANAMNQRVKDFGAMMIKDHTETGDLLKQIAQKKNIALPATLADKEQKMLADLQKKTGKDFDKAYMNMMLDDHKKDIKEFQDASNNCKDSDLKNFAVTTLAVLHMHLDSAKAILDKH